MREEGERADTCQFTRDLYTNLQLRTLLQIPFMYRSVSIHYFNQNRQHLVHHKYQNNDMLIAVQTTVALEMRLTWSIIRATTLILSKLRWDSGPDRARKVDRGLRTSGCSKKGRELL